MVRGEGPDDRMDMRTLFLLVMAALSPTAAAAQKTPAGTPPTTVDTAKKVQTLFTLRDAGVGVAFVATTVALFPVDRSLAVRLENANTAPGGKALNQWANAFDYLALPGVFVIAPVTYVVGRVTHNLKVEDLGWHTTEGAIVGVGVSEIIKGLAGRARPYVTGDTNPHSFHFAGGFSSARSSFPSGHATIAFAGAAAASSEISRDWPKAKWIAGPLLYVSAALVGVARTYQSQHWASDVVLGAGIGTFAGLKVVRYAHAHPDNFVDRIMLHAHVAPTPAPGGGGGGMVWWSSEFR
jgi:membrane-associated phospholipid phosphatase